jgi:hypothetical protein
MHDEAERVLIRGRTRASVLRLFGADVARRPDEVRKAGVSECARDPEVDDANVTARRQEDVAGLDVPVNDPVAVSRGERASGEGGDAQHLRDRKRPALLEDLREIRPINQLHDDELDAAVGPGVEDRGDVRVGKRGSAPRFSAEPPEEGAVGGVLRPQDLDGDFAP